METVRLMTALGRKRFLEVEREKSSSEDALVGCGFKSEKNFWRDEESVQVEKRPLQRR